MIFTWTEGTITPTACEHHWHKHCKFYFDCWVDKHVTDVSICISFFANRINRQPDDIQRSRKVNHLHIQHCYQQVLLALHIKIIHTNSVLKSITFVQTFISNPEKSYEQNFLLTYSYFMLRVYISSTCIRQWYISIRNQVCTQ